MNKITIKQFQRAKAEGRICSCCGWMIPIKEWKKGRRVCWNCEDALKGVNISYGHAQPQQEPVDMTGEMI
jgi:predicted amidophosphoribosyltransferase